MFSDDEDDYDFELKESYGDPFYPLIALERGLKRPSLILHNRRRLKSVAVLLAGVAFFAGIFSWSILSIVRKSHEAQRELTTFRYDDHVLTPVVASQNYFAGLHEWMRTTNDSQGLIQFHPEMFNPLLTSEPLRHTVSTRAFSNECAEQFVSNGTLCRGISFPPLNTSFIYTWVNGSAPELLSRWRDYVGQATRTQHKAGTVGSSRFGIAAERVAKHFRSHDELRYSIRAALALFRGSIESIHVVVGVSPFAQPAANITPGEIYAAQVPHWLNLSSVAGFGPDPMYLRDAGIRDGDASEGSQEPGDIREALDARVSPKGRETPETPESSSLAARATSSLHAERSERPGRPAFVIYPHAALYKTPFYLKSNPTPEEVASQAPAAQTYARNWLSDVLPNFNSHAIESQLCNIDPGMLADVAFYFNDDFFITGELSPGDTYSPLSGPVFRITRDLGVNAVNPYTSKTPMDPEGEWKGLTFAAWVLDQRFGTQERPYISHVAKTFPVALMKEVQEVFVDELVATSSVQFRGRGGSIHEVQPWFLILHYILEKHREALLWSYLVARADADHNGRYAPAERRQILTDLGYNSSQTVFGEPLSKIPVPKPFRESLQDLNASYARTGLARPLSTKLEFTSLDGTAYFHTDFEYRDREQNPRNRGKQWPSFDGSAAFFTSEYVEETACTFDVSECFSDAFLASSGLVSVDDMFKRVTFDNHRCGDCLIVALLNKSGSRGLEAFLPPKGAGNPVPHDILEPIGLQGKEWRKMSFALTDADNTDADYLRQRAIRLIQRYAYTIGGTPISFFSINTLYSLRKAFRTIDGDHPSLIALNDDIRTLRMVNLVDREFRDWAENRWPIKSPFELD